MLAVIAGNLTTVQTLIKEGADVNAVYNQDMTALSYATSKACDKDALSIIKALLRAHAVVTKKSLELAKSQKFPAKTNVVSVLEYGSYPVASHYTAPDTRGYASHYEPDTDYR